MFDEKGVIIIDNEDGDIDEDKLMENALDAGASDFISDDGTSSRQSFFPGSELACSVSLSVILSYSST